MVFLVGVLNWGTPFLNHYNCLRKQWTNMGCLPGGTCFCTLCYIVWLENARISIKCTYISEFLVNFRSLFKRLRLYAGLIRVLSFKKIRVWEDGGIQISYASSSHGHHRRIIGFSHIPTTASPLHPSFQIERCNCRAIRDTGTWGLHKSCEGMLRGGTKGGERERWQCLGEKSSWEIQGCGDKGDKSSVSGLQVRVWSQGIPSCTSQQTGGVGTMGV